MRRVFPRSTPVPALAGGTAGIIVPGALLGFLAHKQVHIGGWPHFIGVGCTAVVATAAAIALTIAGAHRNDGRTVLLGTAFTVMAALLALHGLATPGIILALQRPRRLHRRGDAADRRRGARALGAALAAAAARDQPAPRAPGLARRRDRALGTWRDAAALDPRTTSRSRATPSRWRALSVACLFYGVLLLRALRTFLLTRRRSDLAVVVGIAWLTAAVPPALLFTYLDLGWWLGHLFELVGIVLVGIPVAARPAARRRVAAALGRPERGRARREGGGVPRLAGARATLRLAEKDGSTRSTPAASRSVRCRSARSSACRRTASATSRSAACSTTSASSPSPTGS